jgi:hypothetical protein
MDNVHPDRRGSARADDHERRGRRVLPRAQLALKAIVYSLDGCRHIRLIEVSQSGARLEGPALPSVGKDVVLRCDGVEAFGRVIWATDDRCGVEFDEKVPGKDLLALRHHADTSARSNLTDEEREAMEDWANGVAR